jgi:hypothetical protein
MNRVRQDFGVGQDFVKKLIESGRISLQNPAQLQNPA